MAYRLTLEINQAMVKLPQRQRPGLGRRLEESAFDLPAALVKVRFLRAEAKAAARAFQAERLVLALNERKSLLKHTGDGIDFLGYRLFYHPRLLRCKIMKKVRTRLARIVRQYARGELNQVDVQKSLAGWLGYARFADSYNFRRQLFTGFRLKRGQEQK
jgi:hypothetical protein